jgi:RNA polymerase sigma-70 factor, ECF subfamily
LADREAATPAPLISVPNEGEALVAKLRARDPDAFRLIDILYTKRLIGLAQARLPKKISAKIGAEDVVQSVLRSFFVRSKKGEFDLLNDPESCWRVLAKITRRKCGHKADYFLAQRRSAGREEQLSVAWEAIARGPSPDEAAVLVETIEALGRDFEPHQVRMLSLLMEGQTVAEVAEAVGYSRRTVERFRERLWARLKAMLEDDDKTLPYISNLPRHTS